MTTGTITLQNLTLNHNDNPFYHRKKLNRCLTISKKLLSTGTLTHCRKVKSKATVKFDQNRDLYAAKE